ncbi:radical SAM protein, partial [Candidatus Omnitrophota bacterium]
IDYKRSGYRILNPSSQLMAYKRYYTNPDLFARQHRCNFGDYIFNVNALGLVHLCCFMKPIGSIKKQKIESIWYSKKALKTRRAMRNCQKSCNNIMNCYFQEESHEAENRDHGLSMAIHNTDMNLSSRVLEMQIEEKKEFYKPGSYPCFKSKVEIYPDNAVLEGMLKKIKEEHALVDQKRQQEELKRQKEEQIRQEELRKQEETRLQKEKERLHKLQEEDQRLRTLKKGPFKLYLDQKNQFHIYYKDNEITKASGLSTGILTEGEWYYSPDSRVDIKRPSHNEMRIFFAHNKLPIAQTWNLKFLQKDAIEWNVQMQVKDPISVDQKDASLFLSKAYKDWFSPPEEGSFPAFKSSGWDRMNISTGRREFIGAHPSIKQYPSIALKNVDACFYNMLKTQREESTRVVRPFVCDLLISERCNARCKACYFWKNGVKDRLSIAECKRFVDSLKDLVDKPFEINLGGGEPLLNKGILGLIRYCSKQGLLPTMSTNATLIDEDMAKKLSDAGLHRLSLSLKSLDEKAHDFLMGKKGSYKHMMKAIGYLRKYWKKGALSIHTIILQQNIDDIIDLVEWVNKDNLFTGISFQALSQPFRTDMVDDWYKKRKYGFLWPKDRKKVSSVIDKLIRYKQSGYKIENPVSQLQVYKKYYKNVKSFSRAHHCNFGDYIFNVNAMGLVHLCCFMKPIGSIKKEDIKELWFSEGAKKTRNAMHNCQKSCNNIINCYFQEEGNESEGRLQRPSFVIHNTDIKLSSRALKIEFEEEKELYAPGTYPYIKTIIQFYPKRRALTDKISLIKKQEEDQRKRQEEKRIQEEQKRQEEQRQKQ